MIKRYTINEDNLEMVPYTWGDWCHFDEADNVIENLQSEIKSLEKYQEAKNKEIEELEDEISDLKRQVKYLEMGKDLTTN